MLNLNDYCDTVLEESNIDETEGLYLEEGYYDVEELCEYCISVLENKADIEAQYAARRGAERSSGRHDGEGKDAMDHYNKVYGKNSNDENRKSDKEWKTKGHFTANRQNNADDFRKNNKEAKMDKRFYDNDEKLSNNLRNINKKRVAGGGRAYNDKRVKSESAYDEVNDLFNFDII